MTTSRQNYIVFENFSIVMISLSASLVMQVRPVSSQCLAVQTLLSTWLCRSHERAAPRSCAGDQATIQLCKRPLCRYVRDAQRTHGPNDDSCEPHYGQVPCPRVNSPKRCRGAPLGTCGHACQRRTCCRELAPRKACHGRCCGRTRAGEGLAVMGQHQPALHAAHGNNECIYAYALST